MNSALRALFPTARRLLVQQSLRSLDLSHADRVLIVGAGDDPYRTLFPSATSYVCLDIIRNPASTDVVADAHRLPFRDGAFDFLLASEVLEHLQKPQWFTREALRVLEPGGVAVATVPFLFHLHADPFDYWRATPTALGSLFSTFSSVAISPQGHRLHVISDLITTAFTPRPILFPLRFLNRALVYLGHFRKTTAPSGFLVVARK